ncbi:MAG: NAD(P)-dependent oxidoreductase [Hydrogenibacillus schlegelii]|uniref:3-hydroxyisobutyrate dehydrogenase n=2 Tax=Hydrogenibacillus schlegelii TaxID=1484 RepID=A0A2T5G9V5_HYDSH|nr:NAD(P)-dependent oxidoreductase [Hydrogenibacillus schlegelii]PTQ52975.1 MAG: 3-hydroxyisobutyrate dehydrogenase [Hydrogenibacillus schlegelii]
MEKPTIGFIGLGKMGRPMSSNLVASGYAVTGYDVVPAAIQALVDAGGRGAGSVAEVAQASDVILTSLPSPVEVEAVYLGEGGVLAHARPGTLAVDFSTVSPQVYRRVAEALRERGIDFLGAPVSGGVERAVDRSLTIMVGGPKAAFERAKPIFEALGQNIFHIGEDVGLGAVVKLTNNYFIGYYTLAVAEALTLAGEVGMDLDRLFEIMKVSYGQSRIYERNYGLFIAKNRYEPGFTTKLLVKDLKLAKAMAEEAGLKLPMTDVLIAQYERAIEAGYGDLDMAAMYRYIQDITKG